MCVNVLHLVAQSRCLKKITSCSLHCTTSLVSSPLSTRQNWWRSHSVPRHPKEVSWPKGQSQRECEGTRCSAETWGDCSPSWRWDCHPGSVTHCWHSCTPPGVWGSFFLNDRRVMLLHKQLGMASSCVSTASVMQAPKVSFSEWSTTSFLPQASQPPITQQDSGPLTLTVSQDLLGKYRLIWILTSTAIRKANLLQRAARNTFETQTQIFQTVPYVGITILIYDM